VPVWGIACSTGLHILRTIDYIQLSKCKNVCSIKYLRGGREIAAFEEGREFLGQDPK